MMVLGFLWNQANAAWTGRWAASPVTHEKAELAASQGMGWFQGSRDERQGLGTKGLKKRSGQVFLETLHQQGFHIASAVGDQGNEYSICANTVDNPVWFEKYLAIGEVFQP
jgi:hypothetical protein